METLKELNTASSNYLRKHWDNGGTSEFDQSINYISREKIKAFKREKGSCWLVKINRYAEDKGKPYLVEYTGQMVYNFEYAAIVKTKDEVLIKLLKKYNSPHKKYSGKRVMSQIKEITNRIADTGGVFLQWA